MLMHKEYREITKKDHFWIETKVQVESKDSSIIENTYLISTMEHKGGAYGYFSSSFKHIKENIYEATQTFLSPPVRNKSDNYKNYIWKNNSEKIVVKSYKLKVYEKKN